MLSAPSFTKQKSDNLATLEHSVPYCRLILVTVVIRIDPATSAPLGGVPAAAA
jgi:hypothetical protein